MAIMMCECWVTGYRWLTLLYVPIILYMGVVMVLLQNHYTPDVIFAFLIVHYIFLCMQATHQFIDKLCEKIGLWFYEKLYNKIFSKWLPDSEPVSYTHLTLPTILLVQISVVAVSLKKKQKITKARVV
eukprot:TRINITY_DN44006_c0_g1_i2.p3 TRINITY_DN44006_c0_g1~~TRINITY_DN44006_c0_g1_i2.p3  ORF type:complete len:128 (-),score=21.70 TRINITY_DN44006_c0_g1_i2:43-426(-)